MEVSEHSEPSPPLTAMDEPKVPKTDEERAFVAVAETDDAIGLLNLISEENPAHPIHWPLWQKWALTIIYCTLQMFVTILSTDYLSVEFLIQEKWGGSTQVVTLGQSMFIIGTAVGPAFLGPASDLLGRKWLYVGAIACYGIVNIGVALPTGLPMLIIFMFLAGTSGSVALCNVAGTITDLFGDSDGAGQAMALFVSSANIGPSIGSPIGEWIADNPHMGFPWIGWINLIIALPFAAGMAFLPETLPRKVIAKAALHHGGGEKENAVADVLATTKVSVWKESVFVLTMALKMMVTEPIVISLGLYNGFAYGLLFLYLDGVFDVFAINNGLSYVGADLTFLNFVVGVVIMFCTLSPLQTFMIKRDRRKRGVIRPEARFLVSLFAWTSGGNVSYWSPVIAGTLLGIVDPFLWAAMLNYISDSYPNVIGSAIAAFLIPSFIIAAACAHLGVLMFDNLSTQVAMSILGGISVGVVALVYIIYFFGPAIRSWSRYARKF
ncbi:MFS multidrug transporter-like protein [Pseudohyphozyma bogoriensis]|nr:MFS multidrug transporter-like protein [Pseudohyphozyma bogoriensis]